VCDNFERNCAALEIGVVIFYYMTWKVVD